jgi:hypothetical protein
MIFQHNFSSFRLSVGVYPDEGRVAITLQNKKGKLQLPLLRAMMFYLLIISLPK